MKEAGTIQNIYNVTPDVSKAAFMIISQVDDYRITVRLTLTSTMMREEPTPEQAKGEPGTTAWDNSYRSTLALNKNPFSLVELFLPKKSLQNLPPCSEIVLISWCVCVCVCYVSVPMYLSPCLSLSLADEDEGVLDRPSCLAALAALRHTKWFQVCKMLVVSCACVRIPESAWLHHFGVISSLILQSGGSKYSSGTSQQKM